jgi:ABC-type glutathione transport system ATPase component
VAAEQRAREMLARIGLADKAAEYPDRLSGGQQQRVAIVRSLAMGPRLLLLDEVTSALDPELVAEVLDLVGDLAHQGMTMLIATHEMGFAREVANTVCFLEGGVIVESGPPERIFGDPTEQATRRFLQRIVGTSPQAAPARTSPRGRARKDEPARPRPQAERLGSRIWRTSSGGLGRPVLVSCGRRRWRGREPVDAAEGDEQHAPEQGHDQSPDAPEDDRPRSTQQLRSHLGR